MLGPRDGDRVRMWRSPADRDWYWHRYSANGRVVATGGEGYGNRLDCFEMAAALNPGITIDVETEASDAP